ncbi:MAG: toll/interleukin-1 receptor domain-containing protein [Actinomycetota bacterium]|nr:toll/interleukin-1 receptor domain-containing protein [Actinomycetota bacterium]
MQQAFISYSHRDRDVAFALRDCLDRNGVRVWIDVWRMGIGRRITEELGHALAGSNYVVVLASPHSMSSPWVQAELDTALQAELHGEALLLIVVVEPCSLPRMVRGKLYLELEPPGRWEESACRALVDAMQPNIFRAGWPARVADFAGAGAAATTSLLEEGFPFYRLTLRVDREGGFAGAFFEPTAGAVDVANQTHFGYKLRCPSESAGQARIKLETKGGWAVAEVPLPGGDWVERSLRLDSHPQADWQRLERVTVSVDDRDVRLGEHVLDVADLNFFRLGA